MRFYLLALLYCFVLTSGCSKLDPAEPLPTFLNIERFSFTTNSTEGTDSEKITDAWVYVNDQFMGVVELPGRIPTLITGEQNIKIYPGIKNNGQSATRKRYIFYKHYEIDMTLTPGEEITLAPTTEYIDDITIWLEDFEDTGVKFDKTSQSDTAVVQSSIDPFEGSFSGLIELASDDLYFEARTNEPIFNRTPTNDGFPTGGKPVYMEFDYKTNVSLSVGIFNNNGLLPSDAQLRWATITPSASWNKIYIEFTDPISALSTATEFDVFFSVLNTGESATPKAEIDNVKVIF